MKRNLYLVVLVVVFSLFMVSCSSDSSKNNPFTKNDQFNDGSYTGAAKGYKGDIEVKVTISNKKVDKIEVVGSEDDKMQFESAKEEILPKIISNQTLDIDAVSSATGSSNGIKDAVKDALNKATAK